MAHLPTKDYMLWEGLTDYSIKDLEERVVGAMPMPRMTIQTHHAMYTGMPSNYARTTPQTDAHTSRMKHAYYLYTALPQEPEKERGDEGCQQEAAD